MRTENLDIRIMLNEKNITQRAIANFIGVHEVTVMRWLRTKNLKDDIRSKIISAANSIENAPAIDTTCPKRQTWKRIADDDLGDLNITIKELRKITGLTQKEFAVKYFIPLSSLKNWERGVYRTPKIYLYLLKRLITEIDYKEESDEWMPLPEPYKKDCAENER